MKIQRNHKALGGISFFLVVFILLMAGVSFSSKATTTSATSSPYSGYTSTTSGGTDDTNTATSSGTDSTITTETDPSTTDKYTNSTTSTTTTTATTTTTSSDDTTVKTYSDTTIENTSSNSDSSSDTTKTYSSDSNSGSGINATPKFTFVELSDGITLKGTYAVKGRVESAQRVELYLIHVGSNTPKFIGASSKVSGNDWQYSFDTARFPNGSYYLRAAISNEYGPGPYESEKVLVNIDNFSDSSGAAEKIDDSKRSSGEENSGALFGNFNGTTSDEWQKRHFGSPDCTDQERCSGDADPDKDNLNNNDEFRYGTDPKNPDSDGDGFLDGDEVRNGFNPLKFSPGDRSDKIVFESPKETGEVRKETYQVNDIKMEDSASGKKELHLSGKGLPNSFINIYIFSDLPVILTVKTDANGNWSYVLDKQIEDGKHEVYVAVTDNTGKITAKSEPLFFTKTAEAVTVIPAAEARTFAKSTAPAEKRRTKDIMVLAGIIILGFITALTAIGFYIVHSHKKPRGII